MRCPQSKLLLANQISSVIFIFEICGMTKMTERPVVVKQLPEKLSAEQGQIFLREVEQYMSVQRPRIVLDCSQVRQLDSAGIQLLLRCLEKAMKRNGDVKLA